MVGCGWTLNFVIIILEGWSKIEENKDADENDTNPYIIILVGIMGCGLNLYYWIVARRFSKRKVGE